MTEDQMRNIPSRLLFERGTAGLREWLRLRGLRLSLFELDQERRRRTERNT
jgi:hypothetical protein